MAYGALGTRSGNASGRQLRQKGGCFLSCSLCFHIYALSPPSLTRLDMASPHGPLRYDVSGVSVDRVQKVLEQDWIHLLREECILDSPSYLREKGKPVVALWGMSFLFSFSNPYIVLHRLWPQ